MSDLYWWRYYWMSFFRRQSVTIRAAFAFGDWYE